MEGRADAVAAELADHRIAILLGMFLDDGADVADPSARTDHRNAQPQALEGDFAQAPGLDRGLADVVHAAGIAMVAVLDRRHVDVQDVAVLEYAVTGHAVADLVVDRGADRFRIRPVAGRRVVEGRRDAALNIDRIVVAETVDFVGRHAGLDEGFDVVEDFGGQAAGDAHLLDFFRRLDRNAHENGSLLNGWEGAKDKVWGGIRKTADPVDGILVA